MNAKSVSNQNDPVLSSREGKQFALPYFYPAHYLPDHTYYGAGYLPGFPRQQTYYYYGFPSEKSPKQPYCNGFPDLPSDESINKSEERKPAAKKQQIEYKYDEAAKLASLLVNDYLNDKLVGVEPLNTVMEATFRDLPTQALWKNGKQKNINCVCYAISNRF